MVTIEEFNTVINMIVIGLIGLMIISLLLDANRDMPGYDDILSSASFNLAICVVNVIGVAIPKIEECEPVRLILNLIFAFGGYIWLIYLSKYQFRTIGLNKNIGRTVIGLYQLGTALWIMIIMIMTYYGKVIIYENGNLKRSEYWILFIIYPILEMLVNCVVIFTCKSAENRQRISFAACAVVLALGMCASYYYPGYPILVVTLLFGMCIIYINCYVEKCKGIYKKEVELQETQTDVMLSQIQPHFLYNSLTAAVALCHVDADKAADVISDFGKYLRWNLDSLKLKEPIYFDEELKHIEVYVNLEITRLEDKLTMNYEIGPTDFKIPVLSIQPLVENAIKHGISESDKSGTVTLSTWEDDKYFYVQVSDNGKGFEPDKMPDDGRTHLGISNVSARLKDYVDGSLKISSEIGKGTVMTVTLPKAAQKKADKAKRV